MSGGGGGSENETHVDLLMLCDSRTLCMPQPRHGEISVAPIHQPQLDNAVTRLVVKVVVTEKRGTDPIQSAASCSITTAVTAVSQALNDNREITSCPYVYVQANSA